MSNTDFDPAQQLTPLDTEGFFADEAGLAKSQALSTIDDDPDKAARAQNLSKATGVDPALVDGDLKNFETQHKASLTSELLDNNPQLQSYVNSHPLAAKISNDDYANLDSISQKVNNSGIKSSAAGAFGRSAEEAIIPAVGSIPAISGGAAGGAAIGALGGPFAPVTIPVGAVLGGVISGLGASYGLAKLQSWILDRLPSSWVDAIGLSPEQRAADIQQHPTASFIGGLAPFALTMRPGGGTLARGVSAGGMGGFEAAQELYQGEDLNPEHIAIAAAFGSVFAEPNAFGSRLSQAGESTVSKFANTTGPYILSGKPAPVGTHPVTDAMHSVQAKDDQVNFSELLSESLNSTTRERSPELFSEFIKQHTDQSIGVSADSIRELYGNKIPTADDGILGWVPNLDNHLQTAEAHGGDVQIPIADWLAKVDPGVASKLKDDIRYREGGMTVEETKSKPKLEPIEDPTENLRQSSALKPLDIKPEDEVFDKPSAIGMNKRDYQKYQKLINEQQAKDLKTKQDDVLKQERRAQTAEWKANRSELRQRVEEEISSQPEHQLDEVLQGGKVKIKSDVLTDEQVNRLPKSYVSKDGIHPDDLANIYGHTNGSDLVSSIGDIHAARTEAGLKPKAHLNNLIDAETDRRMHGKYGDLNRNIIEKAKDRVLSDVQTDILHEEVKALAQKAGSEYPLAKADIQSWVDSKFNETPAAQVSSDRFLADAGRAGREAESALLKGDATEAFKQKQRQYMATSLAKEAIKFEKAKASFDKTAKRFSAREVAGVDQEYTNWIHDILTRIGKSVKRHPQDLKEALSKGGDTGTTSLSDFVEHKEQHDLRELPVADFLFDPMFKKDYSEFTAGEFKDIKESIDALAKNGRDETRIMSAGREFDFKETKTKLIDSLTRYGLKEYTAGGQRKQALAKVRGALRTAGIAHLQIETIIDNIDRYDPHGIWNQFVFRDLVAGVNHQAALEREFGKALGSIADNANLNEHVPNDIFTSPFDKNLPFEIREPFKFTRKNLRAVLLNAGNDSNLFKMAKGYGLEPKQVRDWLDKNATKADWDWAQKIWGTISELGKKSDDMYQNLTGNSPEKLPIKPIQTPHGEYEGGYYPLIRHETFGEDVKLSKGDLQGQGYIRATTAAGYTKKRTGAIYPLSLDLDRLPNQIKQVIHDISMRPAVINAGKILYDREINTAFKKYLGKEYADMFVPWLKDVANAQNFHTGGQASKMFSQVSDFIRQNIVSSLVGLNPGTFLKHTPTAIASSMAEIGPARLSKAAAKLFSINEETGESNHQFIHRNSEEIQRRSRNWLETYGGGMRELEGKTLRKSISRGEFGGVVMSLRDMITELSSKPVALGDLASAEPTWLGKYEMEMEEHGVHGDAVYAADKAVRRAHGSSAITSRSLVGRSKSLQWFTGFFTFFNDLMNRQVETIWRAGDVVGLVKEGQHKQAMLEATKVSGRLFAYVVVPAMIEELVTPLSSDEHESWAKKAAKGLAFTLSSSWVGVRDIVSAALNGRDPSAGLLSTAYRDFTNVFSEFGKTKHNAGVIIKNATALAGALTGMVPAQAGKSGQFVQGVVSGKEQPSGPWGWLVGLRYGTLKKHSGTFKEYIGGKGAGE